MTLGSGIIGMARTTAEGLMDSLCVIQRQSGVVENANGVETPTYTTIYSGKCRLRMPHADARNAAASGQSVELQTPTLSLPVVGSENVLPDDIATISSPLDPLVVTARVMGVHSQTHSTARRLQVEVTS